MIPKQIADRLAECERTVTEHHRKDERAHLTMTEARDAIDAARIVIEIAEAGIAGRASMIAMLDLEISTLRMTIDAYAPAMAMLPPPNRTEDPESKINLVFQALAQAPHPMRAVELFEVIPEMSRSTITGMLSHLKQKGLVNHDVAQGLWSAR